MSSSDPQAHPPQLPTAKPSLFATWLAHRQQLAQLHADLERKRLEDQAHARQERTQARKERAATRQPSLLSRLWTHLETHRARQERTVQRQNVRHLIQDEGHEYLALILMVAAAGGLVLFFTGKYYGSTPPLYVVVPAAICLALSIEWATAVFGQDMQDSLTLHQPTLFLLNLLKALVAYGVSVFVMANAASVVWAPLDNLLGIDPHTWAWALAITVFGVQFLLKLTPERPKGAKNIVAVSHFVAMMAPEASPEEQIAIAARMLSAFAGQELTHQQEIRHKEEITREEIKPHLISSSVLSTNHHQVLGPQDRLAPVYLTPEESAGNGTDDATFRG